MQIAARMGMSELAQKGAASGGGLRARLILERYAAALGTEITWKLQG